MPVAATATTIEVFKSQYEVRRRRVRIDLTGLVAGANTIPHGLTKPEAPSQGAAPIEELVLLTSNVAVHRTQPADATNLYYTVDSGAGTTIAVYVTV